MKKIILLCTIITLSFSSSVYAEKKECKSYNVLCKMKKFTEETKQYQKKEWENAGKAKKN